MDMGDVTLEAFLEHFKTLQLEVSIGDTRTRVHARTHTYTRMHSWMQQCASHILQVSMISCGVSILYSAFMTTKKKV